MGQQDGEISPMREAAIQMHEMYLELKEAGFSRGESMDIIGKVLASAISSEMQNPSE